MRKQMFLPRPKCRCVASMIPGKIAMFSSLIKVPIRSIVFPRLKSRRLRGDLLRARLAARAAPAHCFTMLKVLIVCKTLLLIVCRWCATVDRRNAAAFVQYTRWLVALHKSWLLVGRCFAALVARCLYLRVT